MGDLWMVGGRRAVGRGAGRGGRWKGARRCMGYLWIVGGRRAVGWGAGRGGRWRWRWCWCWFRRRFFLSLRLAQLVVRQKQQRTELSVRVAEEGAAAKRLVRVACWTRRRKQIVPPCALFTATRCWMRRPSATRGHVESTVANALVGGVPSTGVPTGSTGGPTGVPTGSTGSAIISLATAA